VKQSEFGLSTSTRHVGDEEPRLRKRPLVKVYTLSARDIELIELRSVTDGRRFLSREATPQLARLQIDNLTV
jgi:hypothetical protein